MAGRKGSGKGSRVLGRADGRSARTTAASALAQAPVERSQRTEPARSRRTHSPADELALRAWQTTYKNSRKSGEA